VPNPDCETTIRNLNITTVVTLQGSIDMSDIQSSLPELPPRATQRPRCPKCNARSAVQRIVMSRSGFELWTLRCNSCGNIHEAQVSTDPMKSDAVRWLERELVLPK
jgi:DNA-directed RNA polymerase subunit M/transcription elongation factor TFIIS